MERLLPATDVALEEAVYPTLAERGELLAYPTDHRYYSVGSIERLPATEEFLARRPTIFLDRDGVLNRRPPRAEYIRRPEEFEWLPGAREAVALLTRAGYRLFVISNQAGIARGAMTDADLAAVEDRMLADAADAGGRIDGAYYCRHGWEDGCDCRKPLPGLLFQAQREHRLDLSRTPFIGDDDRDGQAADLAGAPVHPGDRRSVAARHRHISHRGGYSVTMTQPQRVLVTGNEGFIGSIMAPFLARSGFDVVGLDTGYYRDCNLVEPDRSIPTIDKDIRDLTAGRRPRLRCRRPPGGPEQRPDRKPRHGLDGGHQRPGVASASRSCRARPASGGSCSPRPASCTGCRSPAWRPRSRRSTPRRSTRARRSAASDAISELAADGFSPTFLRNGTVYGLSPRMRFDTVFNSLMGAAVTSGRVSVFSDGKPWRPVVHVQDVSRAFRAVLEAPLEDVHNQAFNTGAEQLNHQIIELAEIAVRTVPGAVLEVLAQPDADQRTYKTDFGKFARTFPDFRFDWTPTKGAAEVYDAFKAIGLTADDFASHRFTRLQVDSPPARQRPPRRQPALGRAAPRLSSDDRRRQDRAAAPDRGRARQDHAHAEGDRPALHRLRRDLLLHAPGRAPSRPGTSTRR